jgi:sortase A
METFHRRVPLFAERASLAFGLLGLVIWGALFLGTARSAQRDLERFATLQAGATDETPDFSLWSTQRVFAWRKAIKEPFPPPLAVLRIPKLRLEVAVLPGTEDASLDRGLGHIDDTALPGAEGNAGIAGHRDGFFRGLKDILPGDTIEIDTRDRKETYRVERTWIVDPSDVSVLDPTPSASLTLVTCYPFYFVGSAPQRFIVRAVRVGGERLSSHVREQFGSSKQIRIERNL